MLQWMPKSILKRRKKMQVAKMQVATWKHYFFLSLSINHRAVVRTRVRTEIALGFLHKRDKAMAARTHLILHSKRVNHGVTKKSHEEEERKEPKQKV